MGLPIYSTLYEDEPDMVDLLDGFLDNSLVNISAEIHRCAQSGEWPSMQKAVHDLKGASANYGFPQLSELMRAIEAKLKEQQPQDAVNMLVELQDVIERIQQGRAGPEA